MTPITEHIRQLLYGTDCVIVPAFGAFVASYVPAQIDEARGLMLPPRKELVFNRMLTHNDGVLVNHIAQIEHLSFAEALLLVDEFVASAKRRLAADNVLMFAGLGSFSRQGENIVFSADNYHNFCTDSYGFAPLALAPVRSQQLHIEWRKVRRMAMSAAMIVGFLLVSQGVRDGGLVGNLQQANIADAFTSSAELSKIESVAPQAEQSADMQIDMAEPQLSHHIVVASFASLAEADRYIGNMQQRGVSGLTAVRSGNRHRVVAASFASRPEAQQHNKAFRTLPDFKNAWVWSE